MTRERNWVQETIDIRLIIDGMIRSSQETDRDLKGLAENLSRNWLVREDDNVRIKTLELKVQFLSGVAFTAAGFALGAVLLAFGWWATS